MLPPSHICSSLEPILTSDHVHEEVPFLSTKIRVPDPLPRVGVKEAVVRVPVVIQSANRFVTVHPVKKCITRCHCCCCQALSLLEGQLPDVEDLLDDPILRRRRRSRRRSSAWARNTGMETPEDSSNSFSPIETPRSPFFDDESQSVLLGRLSACPSLALVLCQASHSLTS